MFYQSSILNKKNLSKFLFLAIIALAVPLTVGLSLNQQNTQSKAAVGVACDNGLTCTTCNPITSNSCYANARMNCSYTKKLGGGDCDIQTFNNIICRVNNCNPGGVCTNKVCVGGGESTATPTPTPIITTPTPTTPPVTGEFPCGKFPNAADGCMPVSFQSWFDNVAATDETMNVDYTPRLLHQHYECNVPAARANGQSKKQGMKVVCQFVRYNSVVPFTNSNSGWYRTQNQGDTYEQFTLNLPSCQGVKYDGKECRSEHIHTIRASDMSSATEMRLTPNANFVGMGGGRHFLSTNWQTGIGYRSTSELTARYWIDDCQNYQRTILKSSDKFFQGAEPIATVRGTISIPLETNGGCGSRFKTFVFLDPSQHVKNAGAQTGTTLMETNSHFSGNFSWDTTQTTNGIHTLLFINMEGTGSYVSASGIALRYNVQN